MVATAGESARAPAPAPTAPPAPLRRSRPVVIALALIFFFGPAIAAIVGVRASQIENKKLSDFPTAHAGWGAFGAFDKWATDHLPLRDKAVQANTEVERNVFGENPNYGANGQTTNTSALGVAGVAGVGAPQPQATAQAAPEFPTVVTGEDGWLFYGTDFRDACQTTLPPAVIAERFQRLSHLVRAGGKQFALFIPPDKSDVYPEFIPDSVAAKSCAMAGEKAFWNALAANPPVGYHDLRGAIQQAKNAHPDVLLYRKTDTHWNNTGALIYARMLADALDREIWPTTQVRDLGPALMNSDLSDLLGAAHHETADTLAVDRSGVKSVTDTPGRIVNTTTGAPLVNGRTLLVSDSFTDASRFAVTPFFANAYLLNSQAAKTEPDTLAAAIKDSNVVVVEIVEREVVGGQSPMLTTEFLDRLASTLGVD
jgi:hypothetical protein